MWIISNYTACYTAYTPAVGVHGSATYNVIAVVLLKTCTIFADTNSKETYA